MAWGNEIIHIRPDLHTGHIQEASLELIHTATQVNGRMMDAVSAQLFALPSSATEITLSARVIPPFTRNNWNSREALMERLLRAVKLVDDPQKVDARLIEFLFSTCMEEPIDALRFFLNTQKRLKHLMENDILRLGGTLKFGILAYTESRVLRKVLTDGVFLTQNSR